MNDLDLNRKTEDAVVFNMDELKSKFEMRSCIKLQIGHFLRIVSSIKVDIIHYTPFHPFGRRM